MCPCLQHAFQDGRDTFDCFWLSSKCKDRNTPVSLLHSPCCSIFPKYLLWLVQFHRRYLNWYWHSLMPSLAPLATSLTISGWVWHSSACFPARRFVFLQMLLGSITSGLPTALFKQCQHREKSKSLRDKTIETVQLFLLWLAAPVKLTTE